MLEVAFSSVLMHRQLCVIRAVNSIADWPLSGAGSRNPEMSGDRRSTLQLRQDHEASVIQRKLGNFQLKQGIELTETALDFTCFALNKEIDALVLVLQDVEEGVFELGQLVLASPGDGDCLALSRGGVLLDEVFDIVVVYVVCRGAAVSRGERWTMPLEQQECAGVNRKGNSRCAQAGMDRCRSVSPYFIASLRAERGWRAGGYGLLREEAGLLLICSRHRCRHPLGDCRRKGKRGGMADAQRDSAEQRRWQRRDVYAPTRCNAIGAASESEKGTSSEQD